MHLPTCYALSLTVALAMSHLITGANAADLSKADIVGLRPGMTWSDAESALKAHNKDFKINVYEATYAYDDGANQFQTPKVLERVHATHTRILSPSTAEMEDIILVFSGTPGKEVVTALRRSSAGTPNPTSLSSFRQALIGKYGEPDSERTTGTPTLSWTSRTASTQDCFDMNSVGPISNALMELVRSRNISDTSNCADGITYSLSGDPVTGFFASWVDRDLVVNNDAEIQAWVDGLQADAVKKREANAAAPTL